MYCDKACSCERQAAHIYTLASNVTNPPVLSPLISPTPPLTHLSSFSYSTILLQGITQVLGLARHPALIIPPFIFFRLSVHPRSSSCLSFRQLQSALFPPNSLFLLYVSPLNHLFRTQIIAVYLSIHHDMNEVYFANKFFFELTLQATRLPFVSDPNICV